MLSSWVFLVDFFFFFNFYWGIVDLHHWDFCSSLLTGPLHSLAPPPTPNSIHYRELLKYLITSQLRIPQWVSSAPRIFTMTLSCIILSLVVTLQPLQSFWKGSGSILPHSLLGKINWSSSSDLGLNVTFSETSSLLYYLWMKNVACHISKQRMLRPSSHQPLQRTPRVHPERTQDRKEQDAGPR